jgi:MOSC domain-containing protein YiiM
MSVDLVEVLVGLPQVIGEVRGEPVWSSIRKSPLVGHTVTVSILNIEGDRQADLQVHGGEEKAVYAYPSEHLEAWAIEIDRPFGPGSFGENLSIRGMLEEDAVIGDLWRWGEVLLQVSQPRWPCFKLLMHIGRPQTGKRMMQTGRTGWYLRVVRPGTAPTRGAIEVIRRSHGAPTVREMATIGANSAM